MGIKNAFVKIAEKLSGRTCRRCRHSCGGHCTHPDGGMFARCWNSCTRPGFEARHNTTQAYIDAVWETADDKAASGLLED